jgi:hypothetical protein
VLLHQEGHHAPERGEGKERELFEEQEERNVKRET